MRDARDWIPFREAEPRCAFARTLAFVVRGQTPALHSRNIIFTLTANERELLVTRGKERGSGGRRGRAGTDGKELAANRERGGVSRIPRINRVELFALMSNQNDNRYRRFSRKVRPYSSDIFDICSHFPDCTEYNRKKVILNILLGCVFSCISRDTNGNNVSFDIFLA